MPDVAQRLAAGFHLKLGDAHAVGGLEAVEQRLRHRHADGPRFLCRGLDRVVRKQVADGLHPAAQAGDDLRPIAGQRLRHILVGGALAGALGIELRIGLVSFHQRIGDGFGMAGGRDKPGAERNREQDGRTPRPRCRANSRRLPCHVFRRDSKNARWFVLFSGPGGR